MLGKIDVETYRVRASKDALQKLTEANMVREVWMEAANKASPEVRQDLEATAEREGVQTPGKKDDSCGEAPAGHDHRAAVEARK